MATWLKRSQSMRETRLHQLKEFEEFIGTKPPSNAQSRLAQKYEYAQSKLLQLQQHLNVVRYSPQNKTYFISNNTNIATHTQSETIPMHYKPKIKKETINKSQSASILNNKNIYLKAINLSQHSHSHDSLLPKATLIHTSRHESISESSDINPYSLKDIHPSLLQKPKLSNHSSESISIRSQLLDKHHKLTHESIRQSLMKLESKSDLHSKSASNSVTNISNKSHRKSPRKLHTNLSPKKSIFRHSKSLFVKDKNKPKIKMSVSFLDKHNQKCQNTIDKVRQSIIVENRNENMSDNMDTKSVLSSPRSVRSVRSFRSPMVEIESNGNETDKGSDITALSILSPNSVLSRRSTVYDLVDESERIIEDKKGNINAYRQSVLFQLKDAENKKQIVITERENNRLAMQFFKNNLKNKIVSLWREYTQNEMEIGYEFRQNKIRIKCWNEWRRMYAIVCSIQKKKYLSIWRNINCDALEQIQQLLDFPTKSRWALLKIISILRWSRHSFGQKRYKILMNKLFERYGIIIAFVLFSSWRSLAQQKNIAAFNIIKMVKKSDENTLIRNLRVWKGKTKNSKLKRGNLFEAAQKLHLKIMHRKYLRNWMSVYINESLTKIALFHWCNRKEKNVFVQWINYTNWSIESKINSDKFYKMCLLKRYFTFWIDELLRIQNEGQWKAWREANKALQSVGDKKQSNAPNSIPQMHDKDSGHKIDWSSSYFCNVQSIETPRNMFFPYYGLPVSESNKEKSADLDYQINEERLSYVKHCELKKVLIPLYTDTIAAKYK